MKYKPFLSLDIETTGLDPHSQILQLAAVYVSPNQNNKEFKCNIKYSKIIGEPFALKMNAKLIEQMTIKDNGALTLEEAIQQFNIFLTECELIGRITVAGKNVAGFDIPILKNNGFDTSRFSHRVIDVGSLYFNDFGYVPTLTEINKLLGRNEVAHTALEDCYDVVISILEKVGANP